MADTTPRAPTDAEIDAAWMESVKKHELTALFVRDFARAVLARWGAQQAPDPRPVIEMSKKALAEELAAWDIDPPLHHVLEAHDACAAWLAAAPQPVAREPMTDEDLRKWWASGNGLEDCDMCKLADFGTVVRAVEEMHRIKGGLHP